MKLNQFAVYRVDQQTAGKALWHLPYQEARQQNVSITVENYRLVAIHEMQENEKVADIWKRTKNQCEVSDVLVLNKGGEISCYYVDENYPQYLAGFIRINTSGALITIETENYQIDGKKGNWIATDTIIIDGKQFYLMEHQVYRDQAQGVILDAYGKMVVEECKKFDEKTKQKIHDYIQQQVPLNPVEQLKQDGKIRLEHYQKFYQNGTYERSRTARAEAIRCRRFEAIVNERYDFFDKEKMKGDFLAYFKRLADKKTPSGNTSICTSVPSRKASVPSGK